MTDASAVLTHVHVEAVLTSRTCDRSCHVYFRRIKHCEVSQINNDNKKSLVVCM